MWFAAREGEDYSTPIAASVQHTSISDPSMFSSSRAADARLVEGDRAVITAFSLVLSLVDSVFLLIGGERQNLLPGR